MYHGYVESAEAIEARKRRILNVNPVAVVKAYPDGSKRYSFKGQLFATNPEGKILWCEDWSTAEALVNAGLAERKFYQHLYGDTEYILK